MSLSIEARVKKLETDYDREISKILEILSKVQQRLVGSLDTTMSPGLISEVRDLQSELSKTRVRLTDFKHEFDALKAARDSDAQALKELSAMKEQLPKLWKKVQVYDRYRWVILGGVLVLGYVASKLWEYLIALIKKGP